MIFSSRCWSSSCCKRSRDSSAERFCFDNRWRTITIVRLMLLVWIGMMYLDHKSCAIRIISRTSRVVPIRHWIIVSKKEPTSACRYFRRGKGFSTSMNTSSSSQNPSLANSDCRIFLKLCLSVYAWNRICIGWTARSIDPMDLATETELFTPVRNWEKVRLWVFLGSRKFQCIAYEKGEAMSFCWYKWQANSTSTLLVVKASAPSNCFGYEGWIVLEQGSWVSQRGLE